MQKPSKPYPDFPLYAHARKKWAKKIKGKIHYFGSWSDPDGALKEYQKFVGKPPGGPLTLGKALNTFLAAKRRQMERGELTERTWAEYQRTSRGLADTIGKEAPLAFVSTADLDLYHQKKAETYNLVSMGNEITRVKTIFKYLHETGLLLYPFKFSPSFAKPKAAAVRRSKAKQLKKLYTPQQVHRILDESGVHLYAAIMLGLNCAYGPTDVSQLERRHVDWDAGVIEYCRTKTGVERTCPLWPETMDALQKSQLRREDGYPELFFNVRGKPWNHTDESQLSKAFSSARRRAGVSDGGFYWLRHTFATVASDTGDQVGINIVMGHVDQHISAVYRQSVKVDRLRNVTNHVRKWLYDSV